jgi:hypothetical protein
MVNQLGGKLINELEVMTQVIVRKVAFNLKVFYIYGVVKSMIEPDTGHHPHAVI